MGAILGSFQDDGSLKQFPFLRREVHQALKDGPAKDSLSGFCRSEAQYDDAVEWLIECYHQPQEVMKQHTRTIAVCSRQEATHVCQACSFFNYYYYLTSLNKWYNKWHYPTRNLQPGDVVILREDNAYVNVWPLGRIEVVFPGEDGFVHVRISQGIYRRPVTKIAPLLT